MLPRWVHVVLVGRSRPELPLQRLRSSDDLLEITDNDLRCTDDEAILLVADAPADAREYCTATEGWITGVRLLALSTAEREAGARAIREFFCDDVFAAQDEETQRFLLDVACLDEVTPALAASLSGSAHAAEVLRRLEREHVFVERIDDQHSVYRVHRQFRAMLREELDARDPDRVLRLHEIAARWFEQHNQPIVAIEHWFKAGNIRAAVRLLASVYLDQSEVAARAETIRACIAALRPGLVEADVWTLLDYATALAVVGDHASLRDVLDLVDTAVDAEPEPVAEVRAAELRAISALIGGDAEHFVDAVEHAERLLLEDRSLAHDVHLDVALQVPRLGGWRGIGEAWQGRVRDARESVLRGPYGTIDRTYLHFQDAARASVSFAAGNLVVAERLAERAVARATAVGYGDDLTVRPAYLVQAGLLRERDDLTKAHDALLPFAAAGDGPSDLFTIIANLERAEILRSWGRAAAALDLLAVMRRQHPAHGSTVGSWITAATLRALIALGRLDAARRALGAPPYPARVLAPAALLELACERREAATALVSTLPVDTPRRLLVASLLRAAVADEDVPTDRERDLRRALRIALHAGFVRTVVDVAPALVERFEPMCHGPAEADFLAKIRRANQRAIGTVDGTRGAVGDAQLSGRELEVLSYMPTQLSVREIADAMFVSVNTLKTHIQSVYRKLGCASRTSAVERARVLQLLK
jgi:LuxR family maltose regulon positive regulatory protein